MQSLPMPGLERVERDGLVVHIDTALEDLGIVVGFSERTGGVSIGPYASLNLGSHVGDDLLLVEENRRRFMAACGLDPATVALAVPEQVHGESIGAISAGFSTADLAATDALMTADEDVALMLCFADCVPIVLVAPGPAVAVVHAGWRGALASLPGKSVSELATQVGCAPESINVYVGPHIGGCCYDVAPDLLLRFQRRFGMILNVENGRLDLASAVSNSLIDAGVDACRIAHLDVCTAESTNRFFSYRAEDGLTGRHGALACIRSQP